MLNVFQRRFSEILCLSFPDSKTQKLAKIVVLGFNINMVVCLNTLCLNNTLYFSMFHVLSFPPVYTNPRCVVHPDCQAVGATTARNKRILATASKQVLPARRQTSYLGFLATCLR